MSRSRRGAWDVAALQRPSRDSTGAPGSTAAPLRCAVLRCAALPPSLRCGTSVAAVLTAPLASAQSDRASPAVPGQSSARTQRGGVLPCSAQASLTFSWRKKTLRTHTLATSET